jgi:hypothetical protein
VNRVCIECGVITPKGPRCPPHQAAHRAKYGAAHRRRRAELIAAEPWCHRVGGCPYTDVGSPANPLTREHMGDGLDSVLCRRCNVGHKKASPMGWRR